VGRDDGLVLRDVFILLVVRCAPPYNAPTREELARCAPFLADELALLKRARVLLALGAIAWNAVLDRFALGGASLPRPRPPFVHGASLNLPGQPAPLALLGSYHVSQQNTQTGRLTPAMFDAVLGRARQQIAACTPQT
jgi:uracil-DNA glycosylase family 4